MRTLANPEVRRQRLIRARERCNEYHAAKRDLTAEAAFRGEPWTDQEDREVLTSPDADHLIALRIGRTFSGVRGRRQRLNAKKSDRANPVVASPILPPKGFRTVAYKGEVDGGFNGFVVRVDKDGNAKDLHPRRDPVSWGHFKGGARKLAVLILEDTLKSTFPNREWRRLAEYMADDFARDVIAKLTNSEPFVLLSVKVQVWIEDRLAS